MSVIAVRGVDRELYKRVKAIAALRGIRICDAFNEALSMWLSIKPLILTELREIDEEAKLNIRLFKDMKDSLLTEHEGKYVAFAKGKLLGVFKTLEESARAIENVQARHGLIEFLTREEKPKEVELGWGLIDLEL